MNVLLKRAFNATVRERCTTNFDPVRGKVNMFASILQRAQQNLSTMAKMVARALEQV